MTNDANDDLPDLDRVYRNYLETCLRLGIEPMSRERVDELGAEFVAMLTGCPLPLTEHLVARTPSGRPGASPHPGDGLEYPVLPVLDLPARDDPRSKRRADGDRRAGKGA